MKIRVFISGSISIKTLTTPVINSLNRIIQKNIEIFIGDAEGIDTLVQKYCLKQKYFNIVVYSILKTPRYRASENFGLKTINVSDTVKKEKERQQEKDKAMTKDSDYSFIIWDGKSSGSYANIIRALENNKNIKIFLTKDQKFLEKKNINRLNIEYIFRENNGYTASEIIEYLESDVTEVFRKTQDLNKYLIKKAILKKEGNVYIPMPQYANLFIIRKYKGKTTGIKFRNEFIDWLENEVKSHKLTESFTQKNLF